MITKHIQQDWTASVPGGIPEIVGDRLYAQDLLRDILYLQDRTGLILSDIISQIPILLSGGIVTKGTGDTLNITTGYGYCAYEVQIVNSYGSTPPTSQNEDVECIRVAWDAQTDMAIPGYVFGSTNYVKVQYIDSDSSQRARAKKAGTYYYDQEPSYQFVVDTVAPTKYDLTLATFTDIAGAFTPYSAHALIQIPAKNIVNILNTTDSTDKDTGALIVEGGIGIEKNLSVGGDLSVDWGGSGTPVAGWLDDGTPYYKKRITIGDWNMDTTANVSIAHGLTDFKTVISIQAIIRNDADDTYYKIERGQDSADPSLISATIGGWSSTNVVLYRRTNGLFDSVSFDSTSYNRGWIVIEYI
ncbi:MAG: hypothetical protein ACFFC1_06205 [Promethearchaeota archaeon]